MIFKVIRKLFGRERRILVDPDFGRLSYENGSWVSLDPPYMRIMDAGPSGPSEQQRSFLCAVRADFPRYESAARAFVDRHRDGNLPISVYSLCIAADDELQKGNFVIEFSDQDANSIFRAEFNGWQPTHYGEDD